MPRFDQNDRNAWENEREGYLESRNKYVPVVEIPKHAKKQPQQGNAGSVRTEERLGSVLAAGGTAWLVYVLTSDLNRVWQITSLPPGPLEVCALGFLIWLHGKWRRSIKN